MAKEPNSKKNPSPASCRVVGIGASAGGLEAFSSLLGALSDDTGLAFVLVQHLDPSHESALAELLRSRTSMPVLQVKNGAQVQPNHVYVIPPNTKLAITGGRLETSPRGVKGERYLPIDFFLNSLARDQKGNAFGVILSGTASDGTLGLKAIKEEGGITFAQDERSAKFSSMPRSAIAVGAVDFILPPEKIAGELASLARHAKGDLPLGAADQPFQVEDGPDLQRVLAVLRDHVGVDFTHYKPATVKRRLARRMVLRRAESLGAYVRLIDDDPGEINALFNDLLINVTEFFRDPDTFEYLKSVVLPRLIKEKGGKDALRVWVPACSTGEEVYSLAICLLEVMEETQLPIPLQIFGTDVSESAIARARQGVYSETVVSVLSPERLRKFFSKGEDGYQILPSVRRCCVFSRHNITSDPPLSRMDLISCRNLLIYLGPVFQKRVLVTFHYAIRGSGCLLLGNSETPGGLSSYFDTPDKSQRVYCRKASGPSMSDEIRSPPSWHRTAELELGEAPKFAAGQSLLAAQRAADRVLLNRYAPAGFLVDEKLRIVEFRGQIAPLLEPEPGEASFDLLRMIRNDIAPEVRSALKAALKSNSPIHKPNVRLTFAGEWKLIHLVVIPLPVDGGDRHFLVLFETPIAPASPGEERLSTVSISKMPKARENGSVALLEEDLLKTRQYLQSIIEELRSANEEIQSSNEELQSTNEELQTAKEELQSTNEELTTMNEEMQSRNFELGGINNDLVNLLGSIDMPIVMLGRDLRIRRFTPLAGNLFHLIPQDVGRSLLDMNPQFDLPELRDLLLGVMGTLVMAEREIQDRQGKWHLLRIRPYRTMEDKIDGAVLQMLDIDALKRSLEEAKTARIYAEAIVNTVREPLVVLDSEMCVQRANRSFYQAFELTAEATENQPLPERGGFFWNNPRLRTMLAQALTPDNPLQELEIEYEFPRIGKRAVVITACGIQQDHKTNLVLLAVEDVTERKQAAEARYRRLFETAQDGIVIVSTEDREITDANPYVLDLLNYNRDEWIGRTFAEVSPFRDSPDLLAAFDVILAQGVVRYDDVLLRSKRGRSIRTEVVSNVYAEASRRVIQFNIRDVTERRGMEEQMRQTAKLESLGLLAGGVAHDFNNLLTGIMGNASLAISDVRSGSQTQRLLEEVIRASERAADLTRQMLAYAGKGRFVIKPVNLSHTIRDITPLIQSSIPRKVTLELNLDGALPPVDADPSQMQQIIMNLVINAAEAIKEGTSGVVTVTTACAQYEEEWLRTHFGGQNLTPGSYVCLDVKDNGRGMDVATQGKIFDPFFTTKFTGRGLGLAAVQGIVRGHKGGIRVSSALGAGTSFQVIFPAGQLPTTEVPPARKKKNLAGIGTVLVVDDEPMVRDMAKETLERFGYKVLLAENGLAGVQVLQENAASVSLVLLDMTMPVMAGPEAFEQMRKCRSDVRVILSSGYDESDAIGQFKGLAGFIQKPYTPQELAEKVKAVLKGKASALPIASS